MSEGSQRFSRKSEDSPEPSSSRPRSYGEGSSRQLFGRKKFSYVPINDVDDDVTYDSSFIVESHQKRTSQDTSIPVYFKVRFTSGADITLEIGDSTIKVLEFKKKIGSLLPIQHPPNQIRLIYQGRILLDDLELNDVFPKLINHKTSKALKFQKYNSSSSRCIPSPDSILGSKNSPIILHGQLLEESSVTNASDSQLQQIVPQVGFDRLQEAGFSEDDIRSLRTQFQALHSIDPNSTDPETLDQTRQLEEAWIDNATSTLPDGTSEGSAHEVLLGLVIGFFVGFIAVFWIKEHVFSRRHQIGIFFGISINVLFGLITSLS